MELVYSVNHASFPWGQSLKDDDTVCKISSKNIVAFTSSNALLKRTPEKSTSNVNCEKSTCYVYVCDIDKPWAIHLIDGFQSKVVSVEWHSNGYKMLIVTESGHWLIYEMQDFLMNSWKCIHTAELKGESFVAVKWFESGVKMFLNGDKKDSSVLAEKIVKERYVPCLTQYAGASADGWIGITSTGMICVGVPEEKKKEVNMHVEVLCTSRNCIALADFMQDKAGNMLLITSNGHITPAVNFYKMIIKIQKDSAYSITIKPMTNFFVTSTLIDKDSSINTSSTSEDAIAQYRITHLKFIEKDTGFAVIVAMGNSSSSQIDLLSLSRNALNLRPYFQQTTTPDMTVECYKWTQVSSVTHPSLPISIALPNFPVKYSSVERSNPLFQYIAVAYKDGSIKLISKQLFTPIATTNLDMGFNDVDKPEKKRKVVPCIVNMTQTFTGCGLLGFDQFGCLYLMKVVNTRDTLTQVHPNYLVSLLEYLMLTGYDWWDVLISLKAGVVENVAQRLSDNFSKQSAVMQEILYPRFMAIRGSLYSCSTGGSQRTADCYCKLLLHSITTHFKAQLRPKGLLAQELGPGEKLTIHCSKNGDREVDNVLQSLTPDKKEYFIDEKTLQALQPLIQWIADLILYVINVVPLSQGYGSNLPGYSLLRDIPCLGIMREMLVLIRIWGIINPNCMPHFTTNTSKLDAIIEMFRVLTSLWLLAKESKGFDFEEALIDKCCLLSSQIYVSNNEKSLFGNYSTVGCCSFLLQNYPIKYTFKEIPSHINDSCYPLLLNNKHTLEKGFKQIYLEQKVDIIHQIYLGVNTSVPIRMCSRCGNTSLLESLSKLQHISCVVEAWEGKWLKYCLCGGMWIKV